MIEIITNPDAVFPYLEDVTALADDQKDELGFIPYIAYEQSCFKGNLFVATIAEQQGEELFAGYVLLGGRFPTKRIFQLAVSPDYRDKGIGTLLVDAVVEDTDKRNFYQIVIKVGEKLLANKFWEKMQFGIVHTKEGGSLHPIVNIRLREISSSLFSVTAKLQSVLRSAASKIPSGPTLYLLDTNVLLDISNERSESEISKNLLRLVNMGDIKVAIAQETIEELQEYKKQDDDPALKMAYSLPILQFNNEKNLVTNLKKIMFSSKRSIKQRDTSDIKHIATAISNNATGLITRDKHVLKKKEILWRKYSLQVLLPIDFWGGDEVSKLETVTLDSVVEQDNFSIALELTDAVREKIMEVSPVHKIAKNEFEYAFLYKNGELTVSCAIEKRFPRGGRAKKAILFLPDNSSKINASLMLDYISRKSLPDSGEIAINLSVPGDSEQIADLLMERGYTKTHPDTYKKICAGPIIGKQNWEEKKKSIKSISQISLPDMPPNYKNFNQNISLGSGNKVSLRKLEDFLSAVFLLPERDGVMMPIKKVYADAFFGHSPQGFSVFSSRSPAFRI